MGNRGSSFGAVLSGGEPSFPTPGGPTRAGAVQISRDEYPLAYWNKPGMEFPASR